MSDKPRTVILPTPLTPDQIAASAALPPVPSMPMPASNLPRRAEPVKFIFEQDRETQRLTQQANSCANAITNALRSCQQAVSQHGPLLEALTAEEQEIWVRVSGITADQAKAALKEMADLIALFKAPTPTVS